MFALLEALFSSPWTLAIIGGLFGLFIYLLPWIRTVLGI